MLQSLQHIGTTGFWRYVWIQFKHAVRPLHSLLRFMRFAGQLAADITPSLPFTPIFEHDKNG